MADKFVVNYKVFDLKENLFNLKNKVALITGAAGLLGKEHASALLAQGAKVILTDVNDASLKDVSEFLALQYTKENVLHRVMDVTSKASIQNVFELLSQENIAVDILINNAAIDSKVKKGKPLLESSRFETFSVDAWSLEINVGLTGAFLCSQVFGTKMAENKGGVILNIASDLSVIAPDQRLYRQPGLEEKNQPVKPVTYSVIKTALVGLTRYLAAYWAAKNVRVNALSPGGVYAGQDDEFVKKLTNLIPMKKMANSDEYHGAIQFLCSDASKYLTGQNIVIDGGRSIL